MQATLCLLDARQLSQPRYRDNENFRDQLARPTLFWPANDTYQPEDRWALEARGRSGGCYTIAQGQADVALLSLPRTNRAELPAASSWSGENAGAGGAAMPERRPLAASAERGRLTSCGWIFDADTQFDTVGFMEWVRLAPVERAKGVVRIPEGTLLINRQGQDLNIETRPLAPLDSRIELIHSENTDWNALQSALFKIRLS